MVVFYVDLYRSNESSHFSILHLVIMVVCKFKSQVIRRLSAHSHVWSRHILYVCTCVACKTVFGLSLYLLYLFLLSILSYIRPLVFFFIFLLFFHVWFFNIWLVLYCYCLLLDAVRWPTCIISGNYFGNCWIDVSLEIIYHLSFYNGQTVLKL